jgi:hypothetical protein
MSLFIGGGAKINASLSGSNKQALAISVAGRSRANVCFYQGAFWARFVLSLDHDRRFSPNFQSQRSDRFKLPLVGMAALSLGCVCT